jgi:hypothetical protein
MQYNAAYNRDHKNQIVFNILDDIAAMSRKFLKQHPSGGFWTELDRTAAKERVMMAFREYRKSVLKESSDENRKVAAEQRQQQRQQSISYSSLDGGRIDHRVSPSFNTHQGTDEGKSDNYHYHPSTGSGSNKRYKTG